MKAIVLTLFLIPLVLTGVLAQETTKPAAPHLYDPMANAQQDIKNAVDQAARQGKHVLLQIGGNWCVWCIRFNKLTTTDPALSRLLADNYVVYHLNYSKENKNEATLAQLGYPQRFGFPVFVVLDGKGNRLHTQNSAYLEQGEGHSPKLVAEFLQQWSPTATDPKSYISKKGR